MNIVTITLKSGKTVWGPSYIPYDVETDIMEAAQSVSLDPRTSEQVQIFHPASMAYRVVHAFLSGKGAGWDARDEQGAVLDRTVAKINDPTILTKEDRKEISDKMLPIYFPEFYDTKEAETKELPGDDADPLAREGVIDMKPLATKTDARTPNTSGTPSSAMDG